MFSIGTIKINVKGMVQVSQLTCFPYSAAEIIAIEDSQSFLFSLVRPSVGDPIKIVKKPDASGGIRCHKDWGPTFGNQKFYDLRIWYNAKDCNLDLGYAFVCPENADKKKYFTGKSPSDIDEMEVFQVDI